MRLHPPPFSLAVPTFLETVEKGPQLAGISRRGFQWPGLCAQPRAILAPSLRLENSRSWQPFTSGDSADSTRQRIRMNTGKSGFLAGEMRSGVRQP